jgi:hypothetical protein
VIWITENEDNGKRSGDVQLRTICQPVLGCYGSGHEQAEHPGKSARARAQARRLRHSLNPEEAARAIGRMPSPPASDQDSQASQRPLIGRPHSHAPSGLAGPPAQPGSVARQRRSSHKRCRPCGRTTAPAREPATLSTSSTARWWHSKQYTASERTPLARMLPSVIGGPMYAAGNALEPNHLAPVDHRPRFAPAPDPDPISYNAGSSATHRVKIRFGKLA